jgi:acetyl esterase/lipase
VSGFVDIDHLAEPIIVRRFIVEPAFGRRRPGWRDASPLAHAGPHWPPTLLINAAADRTAGPQSAALCTRLHAAGVRCRSIVVPASQHSTAIARLGDGRAAAFEAMVEFLVDATSAGPRSVAGAARPGGAAPGRPSAL